MKKSEFKEYLKNEIREVLSEEEEKATPDDVATQEELNAELEKTEKLKKQLDSMTEDVDDDMEPSNKDINKKDPVAKIATKLSATDKEMKTVVNKWKKSEGVEKSDLLKRLKDLTKIKKELEGLL
jgi:siderophore synthetase component|tara:strand:+ start:281 stop:655 length:375 start_codon:yes stop_codon:yes gene_type:complete